MPHGGVAKFGKILLYLWCNSAELRHKRKYISILYYKQKLTRCIGDNAVKDEIIMKRLLICAVVVVAMATGCGKINDRIDRLDDRLSQLEETTIPSIDEQIDGIGKTIKSLEKIDAELKGYIKTLQQQSATATEQIKKLQEKDVALEQKIAELRLYVDAEIQKNKDWAETAFATLEQYNGVTSEIESLNESLRTAGKEAEALKQSSGDLESEIASIKATLAELTKNVEAIKGDIAKLLGRIQSATYVPKYTDGKVEMKRILTEDDGIAEFDFAVTPTDAVKELANVWSVAVKMRAVYTETRAVSFIDMPIISFEADESNGVITVKASGKNLNEDFFIGESVASASLVISDGNASVASEYVPIFGENVMDPYTIYYTTTNGDPVKAPIESQEGFVSNTYNKTMGTIKFDRGIVKICDNAFENSNLASIIIPDSFTSISNYTFRYSTGLTRVTIGNGVKAIGYYTFFGCTGLTNVNIGNGVTSIGTYAFSGCTSLTSITIPDSVTFIYNRTFSRCTSLTTVTLPGSVKYIGDYVFSGCSGLTSLTIPDSVTEIGNYAFSDCTGLKSITIPNSVTEISQGAFLGCTGLTNITTIPDSVTRIGRSAFYGCTGLKNITIPDSVTSIGNYAFHKCKALTSITIPGGVTIIGEKAFSGCTGLANVYCKATTPPTAEAGVFENIPSDARIYVPRASVEAYKSATNWKDYASQIVGYDF